MKPILFNAKMVRAILNGRKTVTRRVIKPRYKEDEGGFQVCTNKKTGEQWVEKSDWDEGSFDPPRYIKPPYMPGDILYVRETWAHECIETDGKVGALSYFYYRADNEEWFNEVGIRWFPSIRMPKAAARIFLRVTDVRAERLQCIDEDGAIAEGCVPVACPECYGFGGRCPDCNGSGAIEPAMLDFVDTWDSTIKKKDLPLYGWEASPWVWVIEFERVEENDVEAH